jgi:hypothetical protein
MQIPFSDLAGQPVLLQDLMSTTVYERDGSDLVARGLYLDMPAWKYHVFRIRTRV